MNTFLVISSNPTKRTEWLLHFLKERSIDLLDVTTVETEGSLGIETVRNLQKSLLLKPLRGKEKVAVIANAHTLTQEAQSALLKTLEEPPDNTYIILSADTDAHFLPTVLSRVSAHFLQAPVTFSEEDVREVYTALQMLQTSSLGDKLKLAETLATDKQKALSWIVHAIYLTRQKLLEERTSHEMTHIENLQDTYMLCKTTNVNTRFALEQLFLTF